MTWLDYITDPPDRNIKVQYIIHTSEYILKLQLHQHYHSPLLIVVRLIYSFLHLHKLSGRNTKWLYVKVIINEKTMTISPLYWCMPWKCYYFEWKNVYMIYLWWMEFNLCVLQVSCSALNHFNPFYSV